MEAVYQIAVSVFLYFLSCLGGAYWKKDFAFTTAYYIPAVWDHFCWNLRARWDKIKHFLVTATVYLLYFPSSFFVNFDLDSSSISCLALVIAVTQFWRWPESLKNYLRECRVAFGPTFFLTVFRHSLHIDSFTGFSILAALLACTLFRPENGKSLQLLCGSEWSDSFRTRVHRALNAFSLMLEFVSLSRALQWRTLNFGASCVVAFFCVANWLRLVCIHWRVWMPLLTMAVDSVARLVANLRALCANVGPPGWAGIHM
uniref:Uncharacterized protein n=1 Tax=Chromera velia CCMP2878 TaxID=1169474 RepID=A0A0G4G2Y2_9ALVE|eukprot:Cvel_19957.t1-p1 / transcript=Cvel_19957.t1 / gene=Cvel_19957 / organism=Chromera_velia_CCMP2878 / gene_product=hypothetical protein / transcript_product=hypothetical protein / location=Cvel_scaffold1757:11115-11885(+) / protein_length=257 / sequence_SO=supercontig / SO=protein_coding / is_pseudo=false